MNKKQRNAYRAWYRKNRKQILARDAKYKKAHKEQIRKANATYRHKYATQIKKRNQRDYQKHKRQRLKQQAIYRRKQVLKRTVLAYYSRNATKPACVWCGETDLDCLSLDHLNNKGYTHRKQIGSGWVFYGWIVRHSFPKGYQTLCMNCQFKKRAKEMQQQSKYVRLFK